MLYLEGDASPATASAKSARMQFGRVLLREQREEEWLLWKQEDRVLKRWIYLMVAIWGMLALSALNSALAI